jgi:hypothetical protein
MSDRAGLRDDEPAGALALRAVVLAHARAGALALRAVVLAHARALELEALGVPARRRALLMLAERLGHIDAPIA